MKRACDGNRRRTGRARQKYFKGEDKLWRRSDFESDTNFDIEMLKETGFCSGIENYSSI